MNGWILWRDARLAKFEIIGRPFDFENKQSSHGKLYLAQNFRVIFLTAVGLILPNLRVNNSAKMTSISKWPIRLLVSNCGAVMTVGLLPWLFYRVGLPQNSSAKFLPRNFTVWFHRVGLPQNSFALFLPRNSTPFCHTILPRSGLGWN